jgi:hypothetical protein
MARSSHPSQPRDQEPNLRRLHAGGGGGGGSERPIRSQSVVGFMLALVFVAVPLYLLRRPAQSASQGVPDAGVLGGVIRRDLDAGSELNDVVLGPLQRVRCGASPSQTSGEGGLCDALPLLESALRQGILSNVDCAPRAQTSGSINFVLEADFGSGRLNVFAGRSGSWRGSKAKKAVTCVLRSLPPLTSADVTHQHNYYAVAILATYPAPETGDVLPNFD